MAQIQIWTRDVNGTSPLGDKAPQHTFFIKINDNGTREIIRGGPINDNMVMGDVVIIRTEYSQDTIRSDYFDPTKPNTSNYQGSTIKTSSQSEIDSLWNKAWNKAQTINYQSYDYEALTQNCNTTTYVMAQEMGLVSQVKSFLNSKGVWTPGFENEFKHSIPDKGWDFLKEFPTEFKNDLTTIKDWLDDFKDSREFEDNTSLKTTFDEKYTLSLKEGNKYLQLADSGMITSDALSVLEESMISLQGSDGKVYTFVRNNVWLPLKDGTIATANTIIDAIDSTSKTIQSFLLGSANFGKNLLDSMSEIFNNEKPNLIDEQGNPILDENGNQLKGASELDYMIGEFVARVVNGESAQSASIDIAGRKVAEKISEQLAAEIGGSSNVQAGVAIAIARIGLAQINGEDQNSDDYALVATQAILAYFGVNPAISAAIINSTKKILEEDGKFNSDGYQDVVAIATTSFVVAMICIKIGAAVGTAIGGPVGFAVGVAVGAIVGYLIAEPVYNAVRNGWEDSEQIYDALEDIFKGDDIDDQLKEALKGVEDLAKDYTIDFIKDVGRGAITLFTGRYGKELKDGQYWNPYPSLNITPKADGTGNIIQGLDPQGVTAIAREYYHDDIYGTRGSDNLIGKSGTNTIAGYEGNDHIEGRGDIDLLIGGAGDDEIFGGNGDDQLYGSEGNDNLFGGNGNDIIIGGTGASISGEGSLEDGADFIQGGNGDDQIMGEAGNDQIQGNSGNDTILGGTGNDRIEGNEGDDSILGEEGDDMILGGVGSDIIDGGSGTDYIEGNEGNDNIRGGDGNDEISGNSGVDIIYGDAGNDLINSGSDNDLVFGGLGNDIIYGAEGDDTLSGELGNDYLIGGDGNDTIDGGAGDDILFGGTGNDIITTGEGNDTIIYRLGDGQDTITDTDTSGNDILRLTEINSKLSDNTTNKLILTKSGTDLIIEFKDDSNLIITTDKITITNQFGGSGTNGIGSEILIANDNSFEPANELQLTQLKNKKTCEL
jgi:Ca2+-binding RTX toxin-like protein